MNYGRGCNLRSLGTECKLELFTCGLQRPFPLALQCVAWDLPVVLVLLALHCKSFRLLARKLFSAFKYHCSTTAYISLHKMHHANYEMGTKTQWRMWVDDAADHSNRQSWLTHLENFLFPIGIAQPPWNRTASQDGSGLRKKDNLATSHNAQLWHKWSSEKQSLLSRLTALLPICLGASFTQGLWTANINNSPLHDLTFRLSLNILNTL